MPLPGQPSTQINNDTIDGGAGADTIDGGADINTVTYASAASAVAASLAAGTGTVGDAAGDVFVNIVNLTGSNFNDTLTGDANQNSISGNDGNDLIDGGAGNDALYGGNGNDTFLGGAGADYMDGGANTDTVDYSASAAAVTVDLNAGTGTGGDAQGDSLLNIENLVGTSFGDILTGNAGANALSGGAGNDVLLGGAGNDTLLGGAGDDMLGGGAGADVLDGGAGNNTLFWGTNYSFPYSSTATAGVTIVLDGATLGVGGDAAGDTYANFTYIYMTDYADKVTGSANAEVFYGSNGADTVDGAAGQDSMSYWWVPNAVAVGLDGVAGTAGYATGDKLTNIEALYGSAYDDTLWGSANADYLYGDAGNDTFKGDLGADTIDGGVGINTVTYAGSVTAVTVNLLAGTGTGGNAQGDVYLNIQNVTGSDAADTLIGDGGNNSLNGGLGNDTLRGGLGADTLNGSSGNDFADYSDSTAATTIYLNGTSCVGGSAAGDDLISIEGVIGSNFADSVVGTSANETLLGGAGNDTLIGGGGADSLDGGTGIDTVTYAASIAAVTVYLDGVTTGIGGDAQGDIVANVEVVTGSNYNDLITGTNANETLQGGLGNDTLIGGGGGDVLDGGTGTDFVSYASSSLPINASYSGTTLVITGGDATGDTFISIEGVIGSNGADTMTGGSAAEYYDGGAGNDTMFGSAGADTLDGGLGSDTLNYSASAAGVTVQDNAAITGGLTSSGGDAASDVVAGFETVIGSAFDDTIYDLTGGASSLSGGTGNDYLDGGAGADTLDGGTGNDTLVGGAGADSLIGGAGTDTASYASATGGLAASLANPGINSGDATGDTYSSIENLTGSGFNDALYGDGAANVLDGGAGNDTLDGGAGADTLTGGAGTDTASYASSSAGITASLAAPAGNTGDAAGDTYSGIENLSGSSFDDSLAGDGNANAIDGGIGNDTLIGGGGADSLTGGAGVDTADYSASSAAVTVYLNGTAGVGGDAAGDILSGIENIVGSAFADVLNGDTGGNVLNGGAGNDTLIGGAGADTLIGGGGTDTASYASAGAGLTANLTNSALNTGDALGDTYSGIANLIGSGFNDSLTGDGNANAIDGGAGNDTLDGGAGADTLTGGVGFDTASYASAGAGVLASLANSALNTGGAAGDTYNSIEYLLGSGFADTLYGDGTANQIDGGAGNDTLVGGAGADTLIGGAGTDTVDYSASSAAVSAWLDGTAGSGGDAAGDVLSGVEVLVGTNFGDALYGDGNANTLNGGAGNDTLVGGAGADALIGGTGTDTASYANAGAGVVASLADASGNTGDAAGDSYSSIENLTGSNFADSLTGDGTANQIDGGAGNDTLVGGAGADTLIGGTGTDTADYSASGSAITMTLAATGSGTTGDAAGDSLSGIEQVIGSAFDDQFTLTLGNGWNVDGGTGSDTVHLAAGSGTVTAAQLSGVMSHVEDIDFTGAGTNASLTVDASFVQALVGAGNASHLTVNFNAGDSLNVAAGAFYTQSGADYTFYSDAGHTQQIAQLTVG